MQTIKYDQNTVNTMVREIPLAAEVLQHYGVGLNQKHSMPLSHAAQTVSASTDEMLAVMEYRVRRRAARHS